MVYENFKQDEWIKKLILEGKRVQINLNEGFVYTGIIAGMSPNSILFKDKFGQEIMIFIKDIKRILVLNGDGKKNGNGGEGSNGKQ